MDNREYDKLSIINVKNKLHLQEGYCSGNSIYVICPFCTKKRDKANLRLNTELDSYYCSLCGENGYAIGLYAKVNYITNKKAFKELMSQEADLETNFKMISKTERRSDDEISIVYVYLLKMLGLNRKHYKMLIQMGFSREEIIKNSFKSIPQNENDKIKLCNRLIKCGFKLGGVPGFYLNNRMKWTFKSHKGFFVPVVYKEKIKGLRIHLENEYKNNTTDIWFSSGNEYKGTTAKNDIMIFMPEDERKIKVYDENKSDKKDIIVATEFLIAYRLFNRDNKITIAVPNIITSEQGKYILSKIDIRNVEAYLDYHTLVCCYRPIFHNFINYIPNKNVNLNYILDYEQLIKNNSNDDNILNIA